MSLYIFIYNIIILTLSKNAIFNLKKYQNFYTIQYNLIYNIYVILILILALILVIVESNINSI